MSNIVASYSQGSLVYKWNTGFPTKQATKQNLADFYPIHMQIFVLF